MGFERVASIIQCTDHFRDFSRVISNYETDIFRPIFDEIEKLSGKKYGSSLPEPAQMFMSERIKTDIAFRVIADHLRTLTFAIADGIEPGNYVLRRILRRAVSYSRNIGIREPFLYKLVHVLAKAMGNVFPNVRDKEAHIEAVIRREEESFNLTLDNGLDLFNQISGGNNLVLSVFTTTFPKDGNRAPSLPEVSAYRRGSKYFDERALALLAHVAPLRESDLKALRTQPERLEQALINVRENPELKERALAYLKVFPSDKAFDLYHTYGFPIDLTGVKAKERGLTVDLEEVERLMEIERARSRGAQKPSVVRLAASYQPPNLVGSE
jgi:alanyl-tRNA synthetase